MCTDFHFNCSWGSILGLHKGSMSVLDFLLRCWLAPCVKSSKKSPTFHALLWNNIQVPAAAMAQMAAKTFWHVLYATGRLPHAWAMTVYGLGTINKVNEVREIVLQTGGLPENSWDPKIRYLLTWCPWISSPSQDNPSFYYFLSAN